MIETEVPLHEGLKANNGIFQKHHLPTFPENEYVRSSRAVHQFNEPAHETLPALAPSLLPSHHDHVQQAASVVQTNTRAERVNNDAKVVQIEQDATNEVQTTTPGAKKLEDGAASQTPSSLDPLVVEETTSERQVNQEQVGSRIPENSNKRKLSQVDSKLSPQGEEIVQKLSAEKLDELTLAPESLLLRPLPLSNRVLVPISPIPISSRARLARSNTTQPQSHRPDALRNRPHRLTLQTDQTPFELSESSLSGVDLESLESAAPVLKRPLSSRTMSTPTTSRRPPSPRRQPTSQQPERSELRKLSADFRLELPKGPKSPNMDPGLPSPMPTSLPLPPLSIPTYLQLELSSNRPSQLYIHRSVMTDFPYESSGVKIERLLNFLLLPPQLEGVLWFGTLACFDAWLYTFTILPLRLLKSFYILSKSWVSYVASETQYVSAFVFSGTGRVWRRRTRRVSETTAVRKDSTAEDISNLRERARHQRSNRRVKSTPSALLPGDKADILKGALIICTCLLLLRLDASRMYHWIRGQAAVKLYVIYNVLEVCDRLFSAIGQDVLECLFSRETLERKPDGHSKILRPFWLFILALIYTVIHSTALFYQVITMNVAVNSYSNALITLLISNQFVEIKSTVFKKFEKENLFQLTCADVVERFQLWLMLTIIASRNIVETGGLIGSLTSSSATRSAPINASVTNTNSYLTGLRSSSSILPRSFTLVPTLLNSLTAYAPTIGHILGPFLVVLGSEMIVDWLKHAYISKFNNTRPAIYGRFLDVLAKDYYSNAFSEQNLTKRLGLPVIPLSCLFIRACVQTYQMFMAAWVPAPLPSSSTSLASIHQQYTASRASTPTSTVTTLSDRFEDLLRQIPSVISSSRVYTNFTAILIFLLIFLVLVACKLVLGMVLLSFSRARYRTMKEREKEAVHHVQGVKRVGGWGVVEVEEDKRRWIYEDDPAGLKALREREERDKTKRERGIGDGFDKVEKVRDGGQEDLVDLWLAWCRNRFLQTSFSALSGHSPVGAFKRRRGTG